MVGLAHLSAGPMGAMEIGFDGKLAKSQGVTIPKEHSSNSPSPPKIERIASEHCCPEVSSVNLKYIYVST
jgi:hypothetical protein